MYRILGWIVFDCIGQLPLHVRQWIGSRLGFAVSLFPSREKQIAWLHLKILRITPHPEKTIQEMFSNLGRSIMESLNPKPLLAEHSVSLDEVSRRTLESLTASERGILALTAHSGNWDLLGAYFASLNLPIHTVGRSSRNKCVQFLLEELRERCGVHTIWRDAVSGVKKIVALLKTGGILAALIDQDTQVNSTFIPFFGVAAKTPVSLIEIAKRNNAAVCIVLMARTGPQKYSITLSLIPDELSVDEILNFYHRTLEEHLMQYPSQWVWFHKRWRSTPDGTTRGSRAYIEALKRSEVPLSCNSRA